MLQLLVKNIEGVVADLKNQKVEFLSGIEKYEPTNKKLCYFLGPEGVIIELSEYLLIIDKEGL